MIDHLQFRMNMLQTIWTTNSYAYYQQQLLPPASNKRQLKRAFETKEKGLTTET